MQVDPTSNKWPTARINVSEQRFQVDSVQLSFQGSSSTCKKISKYNWIGGGKGFI